jgi:hypothetical protein
MKNIHVLPTDKPTGIFKSGDNLLFSITDKVRTTNEGFYIYITSDEEIKVGDWCINLNSPYPHKELCRIDNHLELERYAKKTGNDCKKIILTTDQDLIKDGVRNIDDSFLEWFVKNSTCEFVEVEIEAMFKSYMTFPESINEPPFYGNLKYKIIIPKEEPKQTDWKESTKVLMEAYGDNPKDFPYEEPKQETLEEAAERLHPEEWDWREREIFIAGAKWQQERMYSEEEVIEFGEMIAWNMVGKTITESFIRTVSKELFQQFKKK